MDDILADLRRWGVATVYEASGRQGLIDLEWHQLLPGSRAAGPARTILCGQDDNLMVHAAIERILPGEVVVIAMPEARPVALVGELLGIQAKVRGASALLVDGAVRDADELRALGLPIWCRFIRARGASKRQPGGLDQALELAGTSVQPGDVIVLDADGVVRLPAGRVGEVAQACRARIEKEEAMRHRLRAGETSFDLHDLRRLLPEKDGPA